MNVKKIVSALILGGFIFTNTMPCFAVEDTKKTDKKYEYKTKKSRRFNDAYKYEYINMEWWKSFNDEYLEDYIIKAVQHNHDLKAASIAVDEYYQYTKIQFGNELPMVVGGFSPAYVKNIGVQHADWTFVAPVLVNYEADIFLKNHDKTKSVKKDYEGSLQDERAAYISVASAVAATYFNIVKLDEMIKYQEKIVELRKEIYELMKLSNEMGIVSMSDTVQANKNYVLGQTMLPELIKNRSKLLNELAVLTGETPHDTEDMPRKELSEITFPENLPKELSSEIITNRPDYIKAEKMLEKAGIDVRVAKKEFLPTINLTGLVAFTASDLSRMFNTEQALAALAGGLLMPIFTGGKRIANLRLQRAKYDRMLENYFKINQTAVKEVNDALVSLYQDNIKYEQNNEQEKLETKDFTFTLSRYENGIISKRDLCQKEENLLNIKKLVASDKADCFVDSIGLYKAVSAKI
ncbi:MAG: TolC family protein [Candidatus Gastranaerophilales bacterium]|nr:TolC family protein [Candidatus Gastranaerophilales bacterium]